jgi:isopentenyl-diphosphate delta-isomerase
MLDILTPDGAATGRTKAKEAVHQDGDWHRSAHVWLVTPDRRVLLQRRASVKENWPDLWDISVAGHIEAGETAVEAAVRETREELGIDLTASDLTHLGTLRYQATLNGGAYIENEFHEVFLVVLPLELDRLTLDPREVADVRLVRPDEIERYDVVPHEEEYALLRRSLETLHLNGRPKIST